MSTLLKNVQQDKYQDRRGFISDLVLIRDNFVAFGGPGPKNNRAAHKMVTICEKIFETHRSTIEHLERKVVEEKSVNRMSF